MKRFLALFILILFIVPCIMDFTVGAEPIEQAAEGYDVYEIQYILKKFGYFTNDCTGYFGEMTAQAVKNFQADKGIEATGIADDDTVALLRAANCAESTVTIKTQLNVRENADSTSEVIDSLTRNSKVYIYSEYGDWYHVETENGILGFILKKYLVPGDIQGLTGEITGVTDAVNVRKDPEIDAEVSFKVSNEDDVSIIGGQGDWFRIQHEGKTGYVFKQYVSIGAEGGASTVLGEVFDAWKASITADSLKVRSGPSTGYDTITTISKNTSFNVLGKSGNWYYIELSNGTKGYASADYIRKGSGYTTCTINVDSTLNVRKGPGTTYDVVTTVKNKEVVTLVDDSTAWYKIKTATGKEGYILGEYAKLGGSLSSNDPSILKPDGTFKSGSQGNDVVTIQNRLKKLGYFSGTSTGYYGSMTVSAVKSFQTANGLTSNGTCNESTLNKLFSSSAITAAQASKNNSGSSSSGGSSSGSSSSGSSSSNSGLGQQIADYALNFLGVPYVLGANGPKSFDCSGYTKYVYAHFGITIPRTAQTQGYWNKGTKITSASDLQVGDLVFFNTVNDKDLCDHAGIYIGNGQVAHASSGSARKVVISNMSQNYYKSRFSWGRRLI
ncbi:MAG: SH3 domain-containing protein [Clostridia bacterium]|nr:SH3 domain-containing protein [Clostridia bacterium]